MKIVVTYGEKEIIEMVQLRLAKRGIQAVPEDFVFKKNTVTVTVDNVTDTDVDDEDPPRVRTPEPTVSTSPVSTQAPRLETVEGGAGDVDMGAIFRESQKIAASTEGKFSAPKNSMLDGESTEWPGTK